MALALPFSFADGVGNTASGVQVTANDAANRDAINELANDWENLFTRGGMIRVAMASSIGLVLGTTHENDVGTSTTSFAAWSFRLDPADWAATGFSSRLRVRASLFVNAVASASTHQVHLGPVTAWGGASGGAPIISTLGTISVSVPALSSAVASGPVTAVSAEIAAPSAGWYAMWVNTGTLAAGAVYGVNAVLQKRMI